MIVDSHVHIIAADQKRYPLQPLPEAKLAVPKALTRWVGEGLPVEQLLRHMQEGGVDRVVLVQPIMAYGYDNSYTADSAQLYPGRFASIGIIDTRARGADGRLLYWVEERGMNGLRIVVSPGEAGEWLNDRRTHRLWQRAASLHIPICLFIWPRHIPVLRRVLVRFPDVPVAVDHLANSTEPGQPDEAAGELFSLAEFPNLYLKFSNKNLQDEGDRAGEFLQQVAERFGARRMVWGSNFPATRDTGYKGLVDAARQAVAFLPADDQKWVLGETALTLWPSLRA